MKGAYERATAELTAADALNNAEREARNMKDEFVSTEHILLAMTNLLRNFPASAKLDHKMMSSGDLITAFDLALQPATDARGPAGFDEMSLEEVERVLIQKALARCGGSANRAAEALGLSRSALYRRLQKYGLS